MADRLAGGMAGPMVAHWEWSRAGCLAAGTAGPMVAHWERSRAACSAVATAGRREKWWAGWRAVPKVYYLMVAWTAGCLAAVKAA